MLTAGSVGGVLGTADRGVALPPRVVVVDDDASARAWARDGLLDSGIDVVGEAGDGFAAIRLADRVRPDVVVMDVVMEGLDGIAATRAITQRTPEVQVVLLSGSSDDELVQIGRDAGAHSYLSKGLPVADLVAAVCLAASAAAGYLPSVV